MLPLFFLDRKMESDYTNFCNPLMRKKFKRQKVRDAEDDIEGIAYWKNGHRYLCGRRGSAAAAFPGYGDHTGGRGDHGEIRAMGDPVEVRIHSYELTLRLEDAGKIQIEDEREAAVGGEEKSRKTIPHPVWAREESTMKRQRSIRCRIQKR